MDLPREAIGHEASRGGGGGGGSVPEFLKKPIAPCDFP